MKFPLLEGRAVMEPSSYSTIEIYGQAIRLIQIPSWHVTIQRPQGDGVKSTEGITGYSAFLDKVTNSEVRYDPDTDVVHLMAGGETKRQTEAGMVQFTDAAKRP